ncbi:hypothetical protein GCM10016272_10460 [Psychrobacter glaciei]|uniref:DUF2971 domain-containing protein n=1 Tax=Psychrobacter glaciei TaxID=619771 RepID=A0ABQ3GRP2_9GAMM|nr:MULTISPECIES: DUF2971 domain-containing protein [Psychrobacter]GHD30076.1 hypothetical protein GCM10016272_10460 [Psychrobacter glaciei]
MTESDRKIIDKLKEIPDEYTRGIIKKLARIIISGDGNKISIANAKFLIATILLNKNYKEEALEVFNSIRLEENKSIYENAQFFIGDILLESDSLVDIEHAKSSFVFVKNKFPYEAKNKIDICNLILDRSFEELGRNIFEISNLVYKILSILKIDINSIGKKQLHAERKLAHYTSTEVANILLHNPNTNSFRLNTIHNVNDPSEGKLLEGYLKNESKDGDSGVRFDGEYQTFIGCFTFNHDSLNQFRLYGKQDYKEASGVSLIFNKDFFKENDHPDQVSFIATERSLDEEVSKEKISQQPVIRCVYIDPSSQFIHLAQRNQITFYREFSDRVEADIKWIKYKKYIDKKTNEFLIWFECLKGTYQKAMDIVSKLDQSKTSEINILLDRILLPIKYLIKHIAFQEEQECRMIYITSLDRPEVKMEFGRFLYVEYEADVKLHLDKIYIAPAATQYQPYLAKLLCDTNIKIELSNNPYRQT